MRLSPIHFCADIGIAEIKQLIIEELGASELDAALDRYCLMMIDEVDKYEAAMGQDGDDTGRA